MTPAERDKAIAAHLAAHELRIAKRRKARAAADVRRKQRGLNSAVLRMKDGIKPQ